MSSHFTLTPVDMNRFWSRVKRTKQCWVWTGTRTEKGYGRILVNGKQLYAHRVAWVIAHGAIPHNMMVCHHCDNPPCVRPDHLFLGNCLDNMADAVAKGRRRIVPPKPRRWRLGPFNVGEKNGASKLTEADVRAIRQRRAAGEYGYALGREYGVSPKYIWQIISGNRWPHVK